MLAIWGALSLVRTTEELVEIPEKLDAKSLL
jgi:hypothetical protein